MTSEYKFPSAWVTAEDQTNMVRVGFNDGVTLDLCIDDPKTDWRRFAREYGYGSRDKPADVFRCMFESVAFHIIVSEIVGLDCSPFLWTLATGAAPDTGSADLSPRVMQAERDTVAALQRCCNGRAAPDDVYTVQPVADACSVNLRALPGELRRRITAAGRAAMVAMRAGI